MSTPPKFATELLTRLGPNDPALAGDLQESYRAGRSALWFWRQVAGAIVLGTARDVQRHTLVTVRAVGLGVTFVTLFSRFALWRVVSLDELLFTTGLVKWLYLSGIPRWFGPIPALALMYALSGWLVGRTHRRYGPSVVLVYAAFTACSNPWLFFAPFPIFHVGIRAATELFVIFPFMALAGGLWAIEGQMVDPRP